MFSGRVWFWFYALHWVWMRYQGVRHVMSCKGKDTPRFSKWLRNYANYAGSHLSELCNATHEVVHVMVVHAHVCSFRGTCKLMR